jgi:hypothetical protein
MPKERERERVGHAIAADIDTYQCRMMVRGTQVSPHHCTHLRVPPLLPRSSLQRRMHMEKQGIIGADSLSQLGVW